MEIHGWKCQIESIEIDGGSGYVSVFGDGSMLI